MAGLVVVENFHFDAAVAVGGPAGIGVVAQAILSAQLAVDAIEYDVEVLRSIGEENGAAGGVGDGFEGVFAGGVAAAFIFYRANQDGVEQGIGANGGFAGSFEIGAAGGFSAVGDENDYAAAVFAATFQRV